MTGTAASTTPPGRRRARLVRIVLLLLIAAALTMEVNALTVPPVGGAAATVAAIDRSHGTTPQTVAPDARIALATVAAEDESFFASHGVEALALLRGLWGYVTGSDAGGSTIEIQLAHLLYPTATSGLWGRAHRVSLALQLDTHYTKASILSMYLSAVYFGHGYYGIRAASLGYFGLAPAQLEWTQAALLAGVVQAPSALDPVVHPGAARQRLGYVLQRLVDDGRLSPARAERLAAAPLELVAQARASSPSPSSTATATAANTTALLASRSTSPSGQERSAGVAPMRGSATSSNPQMVPARATMAAAGEG